MDKIGTLTNSMLIYMSGDAKRIQHFIKVHAFAKMLGVAEELETNTLFLLETAALVHDCGIKNGEKKYGKGHCTGQYQEQEGPQVARELLLKLHYDMAAIERVCYLVGHHHTYNDIDGIDYQLLVEADFLANFYEDSCSKDTIKNVVRRIFKTKTGIEMCKTMYGI